jgi:hypothetical protein
MKYLLPVLVLFASTPAVADRITDMHKTEECVYRARLSSMASYLRIEKVAKTCDEMKIHWHGDETRFEIDYVKYWSCVGFKMNVDPIKTGDTVYESCMKEES